MSNTTALNDALSSNYLLVDFQLHSWGSNRTDKTASQEMIAQKGATKSSGKFVKNLLADADQELEAVHQAQNAIRALVYARTLPWSNATEGAKRGARLLAAKKSLEFLKELNECKQELDKAVAELMAVWDQRIAQAKANLGGLADMGDQYPSTAELPDRFGVSVELRPVPSLSDFSRVNVPPDLAEALGQRYVQQNEAQANSALAELKKRLLKELQRMAKQLKARANGEKTRLYDSLVTNLQELVELARTMNVYGNPELTELADKIEKQLLQNPVEVYRNNTGHAATAADAAAKLAVDAAIEGIWS